MHVNRKASSLVTLVALAMNILSGCGDAGMFSAGELRAMHASKLGADIDPNRVTVKRVSTMCDTGAATACPEAAAPALEVYFDGRSVVLDFSNVETPGVFEAEFDGFEIEFEDYRDGADLYFTVLDGEASSVELREDAISYGSHYLDINLSGVAYDSKTFIKIDLLVGPLNLLTLGDS